MSKVDRMTPGEILADVGVADFVREMALGIAEAQRQLDQNTIDQFLRLAREPIPGLNKTAIELGLIPAFYHFQYADLEMKVHLCMRLSKDFGLSLGASYGQGQGSAAGASSTSVDTVTVTIIQGEPAPASAVLLLRANEPGGVEVGAGAYALVSGTPTGGEVQLKDNLLDSARALAGFIQDEHATSKVNRANVEIVFGKPPVLPTTNNPDAFVCGENRVKVAWSPTDEPARAWFSVTGDAGDLRLSTTTASGGGGGTSALATLSWDDSAPSPLAKLAQDVTDWRDGSSPTQEYEAFALIEGGALARHIYFEYNDAEPRKDADNRLWLDRVARYLLANPSTTISVEGHTDRTGSATYNTGLSRMRAESVFNYLDRRGVSRARMTVRPMGETQPVTQSGDTSNYWKDRRVEICIDSGPQLVLGVQTIATNVSWGACEVDAGLGSLIKKLDGAAKVTAAAGDKVVVNNVALRVGTEFQAGASTEATAEALAAAIGAHVPDHSASVLADVVTIYGPRDVARITLTTELEAASANGTKLQGATGAVSIAQKFKGGADAADPNAGDTIGFDNVTLSCVDVGTSPAADQFAEGTDAAETASNLAAAINGVTGLSATAAGNIVTVTGPSGASIATSNARAFLLSANRFGNRVAQSSAAASQASAFAASAGVHYDRKYDLHVDGKSSIKARLVAIPAPPEFLEEIREYLVTWR